MVANVIISQADLKFTTRVFVVEETSVRPPTSASFCI